jgi:ribosomal protein L37AE/L43A
MVKVSRPFPKQPLITYFGEVHRIRKLEDLTTTNSNCPEWKKSMIARRRKTLVVCQKCHEHIHHGRYDGVKLALRN